MKMITRDWDKEYLQSQQILLEENGIPAVLHGVETSRMTVPISPFEPTLWVYLDEQYEDAVKLMQNPGHVVTTGIDVEEFYASLPTDEALVESRNNALGNLAVFVVAIMIGMIVLIMILK